MAMTSPRVAADGERDADLPRQAPSKAAPVTEGHAADNLEWLDMTILPPVVVGGERNAAQTPARGSDAPGPPRASHR